VTGRNPGKIIWAVSDPRTRPARRVTFDAALDIRTSVNEQDYQVPFAFNGTINKLTFNLGPEQLTDQDRKKIRNLTAMGTD
jgi:arylsulfatase